MQYLLYFNIVQTFLVKGLHTYCFTVFTFFMFGWWLYVTILNPVQKYSTLLSLSDGQVLKNGPSHPLAEVTGSQRDSSDQPGLQAAWHPPQHSFRLWPPIQPQAWGWVLSSSGHLYQFVLRVDQRKQNIWIKSSVSASFSAPTSHHPGPKTVDWIEYTHSFLPSAATGLPLYHTVHGYKPPPFTLNKVRFHPLMLWFTTIIRPGEELISPSLRQWKPTNTRPTMFPSSSLPDRSEDLVIYSISASHISEYWKRLSLCQII